MLLSPILPERSLAMRYAPRGVGKSWLGLSMGLAVAAGESLLRWSAARQRNVLYVDGEMPLVSLQERLREISAGMGSSIPNDGFRILAADQIERGINLGTEESQQSLDALCGGLDLLILDNLSTLCTVAVKRLVMPGSRCRIGCCHFGGGVFRSCSFITLARMGDREARQDERMRSIR